jgi:hypothetical protein
MRPRFFQLTFIAVLTNDMLTITSPDDDRVMVFKRRR